jgi:hypothetical protein
MFMNDLNAVTGGRLDLVIDHVSHGIDELTSSEGREPPPARIYSHVKLAEEAVAGLGKKDQLIQPVDEQALDGIRAQLDGHPVYGFDLIAIDQNDIKQGLPGRTKQVVKV